MRYLAGFLSVICGLIAAIITISCLELYLGIEPGIEIPIVLENSIEFFDAKYQLLGQDLGMALFAILGIILFSYFIALYRKLCKKRKDTYKDKVQAPFTLYLRSFADDAVTKRNVSLLTDSRSEEEVLVDIMSEIAPVYAIGDPRDKKMPVGASRIYVDDEHWKSTVKDLAKKAEAVFLRLGKTDSFWWEVDMALTNIPIDKLIFIVPHSKTFSSVANLYKILLDHDIDIKDLPVSIEKQGRGSISSILFFDENKDVHVANIKVPKFTRLFISYDNIIRNAIREYRARYGLTSKRGISLRLSRILQMCLILYITLVSGGRTYYDLVQLKYQRPYELLEECIIDDAYTEKYSDNIDGNNLTYSIIEAIKGKYLLNNDDYLFLWKVECEAMELMSDDEYELLNTKEHNALLMIKKYVPSSYEKYVSILAKAALISVNEASYVTEVIYSYKNCFDNLPKWMKAFLESDVTDDEFDSRLILLINEHINDTDITDVIKIISSQLINIE